MSFRHLVRLVLIVLAAALMLPGTAAAVPVYIAEQNDGTVLRLESTTGSFSVLADGGHLVKPAGILELPDGDLLVADADAAAGEGALIRVDRETGAQTLLARPAGFVDPSGVALAANGTTVYVTDPRGTSGGAVWKYELGTQTGTVLTQNQNLEEPGQVVVRPDGDLLVATQDGPSNKGSLVKVNASTGAQTVLSQDGNFRAPSGLALTADGHAIVGDLADNSPGRVYALDTGVASPAQIELASGDLLGDPTGVAIERSGSLLVADPDRASGVGRIVRLSGGAPPLTQTKLAGGGRMKFPAALAITADTDGDGIPDADDVCDGVADPDQQDLDADGQGDACDLDDDGDTVADASDNCDRVANPGQADGDGDGIGDLCEGDSDGDGVADAPDNCDDVANGGQADLDGDGQGDACDLDVDGDTVDDVSDNCATTPNAGQSDVDADGLGDACDPDDDGDAVADGPDNCDGVPNGGQADLDGDGQGDACDLDMDGDGVADAADNCDANVNGGQADLDADGLGDACDPDADGDGAADAADTCPRVPGAQTDTDGDGLGDVCDSDDDGDGASDADELAAGTDPLAKPAQTTKGATPGGGSEPAPGAFEPGVTPPTGPLAPEPVPVLGKRVGVPETTGTVKVRLPGARADRPLQSGAELPVGAVVDASAGAVTLTTATRSGELQRARFHGGRFRIAQRAADGGMTDLHLVGKVTGCRTAKAAAKRPRPKLWGAGKGRFRTHGSRSVATVRGTTWLVEETCAGTVTRVTSGVVAVRDKGTGRTRVLRKGERYLARRR